MVQSHNARHNAKGKRATALRKARTQAAGGLRSGREELSAARRSIYETGTYAPEPTPEVRRGPLTPAEIEKIRELKAAGFSHLEVALGLGVSAETISRICVKHNIPSVNKAKGGWAVKREKDARQQDPKPSRRADLLAAHDAGLCDDSCRLGRHNYRSFPGDQQRL
jgi:hypothetical protein